MIRTNAIPWATRQPEGVLGLVTVWCLVITLWVGSCAPWSNARSLAAYCCLGTTVTLRESLSTLNSGPGRSPRPKTVCTRQTEPPSSTVVALVPQGPNRAIRYVLAIASASVLLSGDGTWEAVGWWQQPTATRIKPATSAADFMVLVPFLNNVASIGFGSSLMPWRGRPSCRSRTGRTGNLERPRHCCMPPANGTAAARAMLVGFPFTGPAPQSPPRKS